MKAVNISYLKNNLSAILAQLKTQGRITIVDRQKPIAFISPFETLNSRENDLRIVGALERAGVVTLPINSLGKKFFELSPPTPRQVVDMVSLVRQEREEGW